MSFLSKAVSSLAAVLVASLILSSCGDDSGASESESTGGQALQFASPPLVNLANSEGPTLPTGSITFSEHVAPIVFENCSNCHRPGESAPFSFLNYRQIKRRAKQIAEVTKSRFMPPWGPTPGYVDFHEERSLTPLQIAQLKQWYKDGCPEGDLSKTPKLKEKVVGWDLGKPDLVVRMDKPFVVPAEGRDSFRNFVMPVNVDSKKFVRAVEIRPRNLKAAHHGVMNIDPTSASREEAKKTVDSGFAGMDLGVSEAPGGQFIGWTPGKKPAISPKRMAWKLERGTDIVLNMHMVSTGKPEPMICEVGLYFTDQAPTKESYSLLLRQNEINVAAGVKDYWVEDSFVLPTPVRILRVYPHAHYIGKTIRAFAILPNGKKVWLFYNDDWDFNWQDQYEYVDPPKLPSGTRVVMQISFDNTKANPRNPSSPPKDVGYGPLSTDEMATCSFMLEPLAKDGKTTLKTAMAQKYMTNSPNDWRGHDRMGRVLVLEGKVDDAIREFEAGLKVADHPDLRADLGNALVLAGRPKEALPHYERALKSITTDSLLRFNYGIALQKSGQNSKALKQVQQALKLDPYFAKAYILLGELFVSAGKYQSALTCFQKAIEAKPKEYGGYISYGTTLTMFGQSGNAILSLRHALTLAPQEAKSNIKGHLAWALATNMKCTTQEALESVQLAKEVADVFKNAVSYDILAAAYAATGDFGQALDFLKEGISMARSNGMKERLKEMKSREAVFGQMKPFRLAPRPFTNN
ncbi:MAG: Flp pilus assembly protein TadD [Planctomycetota bacterium]|jgi:Flp pilus assembly protein TadD